jgi:hypothetical protein
MSDHDNTGPGQECGRRLSSALGGPASGIRPGLAPVGVVLDQLPILVLVDW